jgi:MFS family permease
MATDVMDKGETRREAVRPAPVSQKQAERWGIASLAMAMLLSSLGTSIANVTLPTLASAFGAPFQDVQWVVLAYILTITVASVSVGRLGDVLGHRRVLLGGLTLFVTASILCAVAPTLWWLIAARALQGLGAAILMALAVALVGGTVPKERTGRAMGLLGTTSAIGTALGPSLGGLLLAGPGWSAAFFVMAGLGVVNFLLASRFLPAREKNQTGKAAGIDVPGSLLLAIALGAYALAMTAGRGEMGLANLGLLLVAVFAGGCFVVVEMKVAVPLVRLASLKDANFSTGLALNLVVAAVMMATLVVGPFYLARALGLGAVLVGVVMSVGPVVSVFSGVPAGRAVDRFGAWRMASLGLGGMTAGAFGLALLPEFFGIAGYVASLILLTPSYQLFQAANNTAIMKGVSPDQRGVFSGMLTLSRNLGLLTGASLMGAAFAFAVGTSDIVTAAPDKVASGMTVTFMFAGALLAMGLVRSLGRGGKSV